MKDAPWKEEAVAVRTLEHGRRGERVIVAEGTLAEVVDSLSKLAGGLCPTTCISILNRRVPPFHYEAREITKLIKARRRERYRDL